MQQFDDATLEELERLAGLFFSPKQIAVILQFDLEKFKAHLLDDGSPLYEAYQRGKLSSEADLRESIIAIAKQGSSPAQTQAMELLRNQDLDE